MQPNGTAVGKKPLEKRETQNATAYLEEPFPQVGLGILSCSQFIYILNVSEMNSLLIITIENE